MPASLLARLWNLQDWQRQPRRVPGSRLVGGLQIPNVAQRSGIRWSEPDWIGKSIFIDSAFDPRFRSSILLLLTVFEEKKFHCSDNWAKEAIYLRCSKIRKVWGPKGAWIWRPYVKLFDAGSTFKLQNSIWKRFASGVTYLSGPLTSQSKCRCS